MKMKLFGVHLPAGSPLVSMCDHVCVFVCMCVCVCVCVCVWYRRTIVVCGCPVQKEHRPPTRALQTSRILGQPLKLWPGVTDPLCFGLQISAPDVSWAASLSLSLWIPRSRVDV